RRVTINGERRRNRDCVAATQTRYILARQQSGGTEEKWLQSGGERSRIGITPIAFLLERAKNHRLEIGREIVIRPSLDEPRRPLREMFDEVTVRRFAGEWRDAEEHFVEDDAERVEIGAAVERFTIANVTELLRRHVFRIPDQHSGLRR